MQTDLDLSPPQAPRAALPDDDAEFVQVKGVIDSVIKPLIAIDVQGKVLDITPVAAMLLKGQVDKIKDAPVSAVFPELEGDINRVAGPLTTFARRGDGSHVPVRLTVMRVISDHLDGWMIFVQVRKAPSLKDGLSQLGSGSGSF